MISEFMGLKLNSVFHLGIVSLLYMNFRFPSIQKLKSKKHISNLFESGITLKEFPLRMKYIEAETEVSKVVISVPKRLVKKAVDRNRIKRQIRESYRLNQYLLSMETKLHLMFIFTNSKEVPFETIDKKMKKLLSEIMIEI
ncbi:ribonuclease P protein component [Urechidicola sp. KH5]